MAEQEKQPEKEIQKEALLKEPAEGKEAAEYVHEDPKKLTIDLAEFNKNFTETKEKNSGFERQLKEWDSLSPENIIKMRRAGTNMESDEKNAIKKHTLLASSFMEIEKVKGQVSYRIDFKGNSVAENYIGAGDLLPPNVESIMVIDSNGNVVSKKASRSINRRSRIGYYDEETNDYVPIHSGFQIVVLSTRTGLQKTLDTKPSMDFIPDPVLARRQMREHLALFREEGTNTDRDDMQFGLDNKLPASASITLKPEEQKEGAKKEQVTTSELKKEGYKRLKKADPKVTREAVRCLKKGGPIGTTHYMEIDGVKYAFHREWHKHPASDRRPDGKPLPAALYKRHHGISVFEAA